MANAGTLANQQKPAVFHAQPKRALARLAEYWDLLAVLLLTVASLPLAWLAPRALIIIRRPGTFDDHWVLDTAFKASRGIWYLRDALFVYGPLSHWLLAAPSRLVGLSMGSIYTSYGTLVLWCSFMFACLTLRLLLPEQPAWKRFLLLLLLAVFWAPWDGHTAFGIFLFAVFLRGWYSVRELRLKPVLFGGTSALLCAVAFLYSADTGDVSSEVWFYPWNDADLGPHFDADAGRGRRLPRPAVARLRLLLSPLDWVSQTPDTIAVESADAVKFNMGH